MAAVNIRVRSFLVTRTGTGRIIPLEVSSTHTIADVKAEICREEGIQESEQTHLILKDITNNVILNDDRELRSYDITDESYNQPDPRLECRLDVKSCECGCILL